MQTFNTCFIQYLFIALVERLARVVLLWLRDSCSGWETCSGGGLLWWSLLLWLRDLLRLGLFWWSLMLRLRDLLWWGLALMQSLALVERLAPVWACCGIAGFMLSSVFHVILCSSVLLCCSGKAFKIHSLCYLQLNVIFWWGVDKRWFHVILCFFMLSVVLLFFSVVLEKLWKYIHYVIFSWMLSSVDVLINAGFMLSSVFSVILCSSDLLCRSGKTFKIYSLCYLQLNVIFCWGVDKRRFHVILCVSCYLLFFMLSSVVLEKLLKHIRYVIFSWMLYSVEVLINAGVMLSFVLHVKRIGFR